MDHEESRQENAWKFINTTFIKLLQGDKKISYEMKKSVEAFWVDLFAEEIVRNNMLQAINNFLWEIDVKMDSARKAGIMQALSAVELQGSNSVTGMVAITDVVKLIEDILKSEESPEEKIQDIENTDLSEVGGGDEDDTPLL